MTRKQRSVIERARKTPAQFVSIPRLERFTACQHNRDQRAIEQAKRVTALLEAEQRRLIKEWNRK